MSDDADAGGTGVARWLTGVNDAFDWTRVAIVGVTIHNTGSNPTVNGLDTEPASGNAGTASIFIVGGETQVGVVLPAAAARPAGSRMCRTEVFASRVVPACKCLGSFKTHRAPGKRLGRLDNSFSARMIDVAAKDAA